MDTGGANANIKSAMGSQRQRPRPETRNSATTPAVMTSQPMYPMRNVGDHALECNAQCVIAEVAIEHC
jgi:hypothetical protein